VRLGWTGSPKIDGKASEITENIMKINDLRRLEFPSSSLAMGPKQKAKTPFATKERKAHKERIVFPVASTLFGAGSFPAFPATTSPYVKEQAPERLSPATLPPLDGNASDNIHVFFAPPGSAGINHEGREVGTSQLNAGRVRK
jgi:hypothetical protein